MRAREKLDEAAYFLGMLKQAKGTAYHYILSAFIVAWRSVVDVMLFDFVEKYSLGFRPEDRVDDRMFEAVARALKRNEASGSCHGGEVRM